MSLIMAICLTRGEQQKNCPVKKAYVYCKQSNGHCRNLCLTKFTVDKSSEMVHSVSELLSANVAIEHTLHGVLRRITADANCQLLLRFIATHGKPKRIISDNASQFKVGKSAVEEAWQISTTSPATQMTLYTSGYHSVYVMYTDSSYRRILVIFRSVR